MLPSVQSAREITVYNLPAPRCSASEVQLQCELNDSGVVDGSVHHSKARERVHILHAATSALQVELWVVENVEELSSEVEAEAFANREMLDQRQVGIDE